MEQAEILAYFENRVFLGDCLEVLRFLPDNCIDCIVTDPPYGLGNHEPTIEEIIHYLRGERLDTGGDFMGKEWDIPSVLVWKECYRVLKPGGHVFSFGGTRTWDLISLGLRAAGFEMRDTIKEDHPAFAWVHGQGFPKSLNIGKAIDKSKGAERTEVIGVKPGHEEFVARETKGHIEAFGGENSSLDGFDRPWMHDEKSQDKYHQLLAPATTEAAEWEGWGTALKPSWEPILVFRKPVEGTIAENVLKYGTGGLNIEATRVKHASKEDFEKHKAMVDRLKEQGGSLGDSWKNSSDLSGANDVKTSGRWPPNMVMAHADGCKKVGTKKVKATSISVGSPTQAVRRSGVHSEVGGHQTIGRVQPVTGHADADGQETVEAWECVEGCPVQALDEQSGTLKNGGDVHQGNGPGGFSGNIGGKPTNYAGDSGGASRFFPQFEADVWECADGCPVKALDDQSGTTSSGAMRREVPAYEGESATGFLRGRSGPSNQHGDSGGASRFFPQFEGQTPPAAPFMYTSKVSKREATLEGQVPNKHPTKKPLALIQWLVRLGTPKGGIVLDPYVGSGTTCVAAVDEGVRFIGIEKDNEFYPDTVKRVDLVAEKDEYDRRDIFEMLDG